MRNIDKICRISRVPILEGDRVLFVVIQETDWSTTEYRDQDFLGIIDAYDQYKRATPEQQKIKLQEYGDEKPLDPFYALKVGTYDGKGGVRGVGTYYQHKDLTYPSRELEADQEVWIHQEIAELLLDRPLNPKDLETDMIDLVRITSQMFIPIWYLDPLDVEFLTEEYQLRAQAKLSRAITALIEKQISKFH